MVFERSYRTLLAFAAIAASLAAASRPARGADDKPVFVELKGSDTVNLDATKETDQVEFPLRVSTDVEVGEVRLLRVLLDGRRGAWASTFAPRFVRPVGASMTAPPQSLVLAVDLGNANKPGTYVVTLEIGGKKRAAAPAATGKPNTKAAAQAKASAAAAVGPAPSQMLELKFVHVEAQLKFDGPIVVERVVQIPFLWAQEDVARVVLRETGEASRVTGLEVMPRDAWQKDRREGRLVVASQVPALVVAGGHPEIRFRSEGDFSMGTAQGTIDVAGHELKASLIGNYEVRSRLGRVWVFVLIGLGLLVGYVLRTFAPRVIATNQTVLDAAAFILELDPHLKDPDDELRATAGALAKSVNEAVSAHGRDDLVKTRLAEARTALAAALQAREGRSHDAAVKMRTLDGLLDTELSLPAELRSALDARRDDVTRARAMLAAHNYSGALAVVATATEALGHTMAPLIAPWARQLDDMLARLRSVAGDLPSAASPELEGAGKVREALAQLESVRAPDPDPIEALYKVSDARADCGALLAHVGAIVWNEGVGVRGQLHDVSDGTITQELDELGAALDRLKKAAAAPPEAGELPIALRDVTAAARKAALAVCGQTIRWAGKEQELTRINAEIDARQLESAAADIKRVLGVKKPLALGPGGPAPVGAAAPAGAPFAAWRSDAPERLAIASFARLAGGPTEAERSAAERRIRWVKRSQYVLATVIILAVGAATLGQTFVGTPFEILGLFFWGFGTDVSVATATELAPRKKA